MKNSTVQSSSWRDFNGQIKNLTTLDRINMKAYLPNPLKSSFIYWYVFHCPKNNSVSSEPPEELKAKVRKGTQKKQASPSKVLNDFQGLQYNEEDV